jgi:hypothetical protein
MDETHIQNISNGTKQTYIIGYTPKAEGTHLKQTRRGTFGKIKNAAHQR